MCRTILIDLCITASCILIFLGFVLYTTNLSHDVWSAMRDYAVAQAKQASYDVIDSAKHQFTQTLLGNETKP